MASTLLLLVTATLPGKSFAGIASGENNIIGLEYDESPIVQVRSASSETYTMYVDEYNALHDLYLATNGPSWTWQSSASGAVWNFTSDATHPDPCADAWQGVTCALEADPLQYYVTSLALPSYNLAGTLPASISNLTRLVDLYLYSNLFNGSIPAALGSIGSLVDLRLYDNQLNGSIPKELGGLGNLTRLFLYSNQLTGSIPKELGDMGSLLYLYLYSNLLNGSIPAELGSLDSLLYLSLYDNLLSGSIPASLGGLGSLQYLYLYSNQLEGEIPSEIGSLANLVNFIAYDNKLEGEIPASLGNLANLVDLYLYSNLLTGSIPPQLGNLTNLRALSVNNNELTGIVPSSLCALSLYALSIQNNPLDCYPPCLSSSATRLTTGSVAACGDPSAEPSAAPTPDPLSPTPVPTPTPGTPTLRPTAAPSTTRPSRLPTAAPTNNDLVKFSAVQPMTGVSVSDYRASRALYDTTLQQSIAASMTGVGPEDVLNLDLVSTTRRSMRRLGTSTSPSTGTLTYKVQVHDASLSYTTLSAELQQSVTDGTFNTLLNSYATTNGATGLEIATSSSVTTENLDDGSGSSGLSASDKAQIGFISAACFVFAILVAGLAWFAYLRLGKARSLLENSQCPDPRASEVEFSTTANPVLSTT